MKVALAQIAPRLGDVGRNLALHKDWIRAARKEKADLLVFPELSLTGYVLRDLVDEVALDPERSPLFAELAALSRGLSVVVGFVEERRDDPGLFYNAAAFFSGGRLLHVHRKVFLPTGGMFEEGKFFAAGRDFTPFRAPFGRAGLMICRDFLQLGAGYLTAAGGAEVVIVPSAGPGRGFSENDGFATSRMWELMGEAFAYFSTSYVLYCNRVGVEEGMTFAGGSFIFGPRGDLVEKADYMDEGLLLRTIDLTAVRDARRKRTFRRDDRPEVVLHALERILGPHAD
jgi:predicted amidohydrolase